MFMSFMLLNRLMCVQFVAKIIRLQSGNVRSHASNCRILWAYFPPVSEHVLLFHPNVLHHHFRVHPTSVFTHSSGFGNYWLIIMFFKYQLKPARSWGAAKMFGLGKLDLCDKVCRLVTLEPKQTSTTCRDLLQIHLKCLLCCDYECFQC